MFASLRTVSVISALLSWTLVSQAEESIALPDFKKDVLPILQSHCVRCHGPKKQESRIRLDTLSTNLIKDRAAAEYWHEVLNVLKAGEMPPEGEKQLSTKQRTTLTVWISDAIGKAVNAQRDSSGRVVLRRLNRVEYQNTMFDLLGLDMNYARDLPPDAISASGFRNEGLALRMSGIQLEYYLDTARRALDRIIVSGPAPQVFHHEFQESNVKGWLGPVDRHNRLGRQQQFLATMPKDYPEQGEFRVRVKLTAELKPDKGFPILEVAVGYRPDTKILFREAGIVEITSPDEQVLEFRGRLENHPLPVRGQGKFPGLVVRARNIYDDGSPLPKATKGKGDKKRGTVYPDEPALPTITIQSVEFDAPVFDQWPPALHRGIVFDSDKRESDESAYVAEILKPFMQRAFRREIETAEVDRMVSFFDSIRPEFPTFEEAIRETLAMLLIRPDFLYLMEPAGNKKRTIGDWELASRLSYFLWSTMPDERLFDLAAAGKLLNPKTLASEVDRMLSDPRASRFTDQFTEQWLHLDVVDSVAISRDYHPGFKDELKNEMRAETQAFFAELLRHNLSAVNLLNSEFTMLNEPLAKHYGIDGVLGRDFRRVPLKPELHRGGLLGQASILLSNSTGEDSHAVRRAVWIRDRLLNDPPAPPPPDVPALDEADPKFLKLSIREQLKIHRGTEACASCHKDIDPWGIALENFDAVGLWRDEVRRKAGKKFETQPVNASDVFPSGLAINGVDDLKKHLVTERKDDFARSLVVRLLTYSLGRRLELSDEAAIDDLTGQFTANGFVLRQLIQSIVISEPFLTK
jgi:hypothetical protein